MFFWSFFSQRPSRMKPPKLCPWENLAPLLLILSQNSVSNFFLGHPVYNFLTFPYQKNMYLLAMHTIFWNEYKVAKKKILKYPMTVDLPALILFLRQKKQWLNSFKCCYLKWTDDPVEQNWLKCLGCSLSRLTNSAQQVLEPDQLPSVSFDTQPNLIQFGKSLGSG